MSTVAEIRGQGIKRDPKLIIEIVMSDACVNEISVRSKEWTGDEIDTTMNNKDGYRIITSLAVSRFSG